MTMEKNSFNFPTVDISDARRKYSLVDFNDLEFKNPSSSDELQAREFYGDSDTIDSLKISVRERGLLESPIVMEPDSIGGKFRVLEGNRRCYAIKCLLDDGVTSTNNGKSLSKVKCEVRSSKLALVEEFFQEWLALNEGAAEDEQDAVRENIESQVIAQLSTDALTRNTQRMNWSPIEQARAIKSLLDRGEPMDKVSRSSGLAENTIKARLSLLSREDDMPEVIEALDKGQITFHVGKILANVKDDEARKEILTEAISSNASGNEVKDIINKKHEESVAAKGEGIKAQHRNKDSSTSAAKQPTKSSSSKPTVLSSLGIKKERDILEAITDLSAERETLQAINDDASNNSILDIEIAVKVLQWVLNPNDSTKITGVLFGQEN